MTLDEAINKNIKMAELQERLLSNANDSLKEIAMKFAAEYRQLAEWVTELKDLREVNKVLISECDRLIKEKGELLKKSEQTAEYKQFLKLAVEDFTVYGTLKDLPTEQRVQNPDWQRFNRVFDILDHRWRYTDEVLKLLGEDEANEHK